MNQNLPLLYSFRRCPYAMRARLAILFGGQQVILREVVLRNKPQDMLNLSPKATVPVLALPDGQVIEESREIMSWAMGELTDKDALTLIAHNDGPFKHHLDRYKYANRHTGEDPIQHRAQAMEFVAELSARLQKNAFLLGPTFSQVDLAIFPFVRQFAAVDQDWFKKTAPKPVQSWLQNWLQSPEFLHIMRKLPPWAPDDVPALFPFESAPNAV
jgi:glutathione S-transferase